MFKIIAAYTKIHNNLHRYEERLKSTWTRLITPSWIFVEGRCGLFFEVPPLARDVLLTMLHPILEKVLQTVCRKL